MSLRYVLDSMVISEPMRQQPHARVLARLKENEGRMALASVTWHEVLFGLYRMPSSRRRQAIEQYLLHVVAPRLPILDYDRRAAEWHAVERARLMATGRTPPFADGLIAATAMANDLIVASRNADHFKEFDGLPVENWYD